MDILLFTGHSAVGKTTLSQKMAEKLGFEFISVRPLLRRVAIEKGYERIRYWIANNGAQEVIAASREEIIRAIKEKEGAKGVVVDDNFDRGLCALVKENFPGDRVWRVAITTNESQRELQMANRLGGTVEKAREEMKLLDDFKHEAGISEVIEQADVTITSTSLEAGLQALVERFEIYRRSQKGKER